MIHFSFNDVELKAKQRTSITTNKKRDAAKYDKRHPTNTMNTSDKSLKSFRNEGGDATTIVYEYVMIIFMWFTITVPEPAEGMKYLE